MQCQLSENCKLLGYTPKNMSEEKKRMKMTLWLYVWTRRKTVKWDNSPAQVHLGMKWFMEGIHSIWHWRKGQVYKSNTQSNNMQNNIEVNFQTPRHRFVRVLLILVAFRGKNNKATPPGWKVQTIKDASKRLLINGASKCEHNHIFHLNSVLLSPS